MADSKLPIVEVVERRVLTYHLQTLLLFTKSDLRTALLPQSLFAISLALASHPPLNLLTRLPHMLLYIFLHLLVQALANQRLPASLLEDTTNKPWRPLPSARLTSEEACTWLLIAVPTTVLVGTALADGEALPGLVFLVAAWMYNDLGGADRGPLLRNALNVLGLSCLGWGALAALCGGRDGLGDSAFRWLAIMGCVVMTTVHTLDLRDMPGDASRQRRTMPLEYGEEWTRSSIAASVLVWSAVCLWYREVVSVVVWCVTLGLGGALAALVTVWKSEAADEVAWQMWCVWMAVLYSLPMFGKGGLSPLRSL